MATLGDWLIDRGWRGRLVRWGLLKPASTERDDHQLLPVEVPFPPWDDGRTMVVLTAGQSNAANAGTDPMGPVPGVFNLYRGRLYQARDPLLGASGNGGSVWMRFSREVLASGLFERVILVPVAIGGTRIAHWAPGGELAWRIPDAIGRVHALGLDITHVIWHQGESDTQYGTSRRAYAQALRSVVRRIRACGVPAPIMVCLAAQMRDLSGPQIIAAQKDVIASEPGLIAGPDTDELCGGDYRSDRLHFNAKGFESFARGLFLALPEMLARSRSEG